MPSALPALLRPTARGGDVAVVLFGAWNLLVWGARVRNIVVDPDLGMTARLAWAVPAVLFAAGGAVALLHRFVRTTVTRRVVVVTAVGALLYWPVRTVLLVGNGHPAAFVVVHLVLAVVSCALAVGVLLRSQSSR